MVGVGADEVEPAARLARVADRDLDRRAFGAAVRAERRAASRRRCRIRPRGRRRSPPRRSARRRRMSGRSGASRRATSVSVAVPDSRLRARSRSQLEPHVLEAGGAITDEVRARTGRSEGAGHAGADVTAFRACRRRVVALSCADDERARTRPPNPSGRARDAGRGLRRRDRLRRLSAPVPGDQADAGRVRRPATSSASSSGRRWSSRCATSSI